MSSNDDDFSTDFCVDFCVDFSTDFTVPASASASAAASEVEIEEIEPIFEDSLPFSEDWPPLYVLETAYVRQFGPIVYGKAPLHILHQQMYK